MIAKSIVLNLQKQRQRQLLHNHFYQNHRRRLLSSSFSTYPCLKILPEVSHAQQNKTPIVALESTIIAHGMPHPTNLELMNEVDSILRSKGVIPATIAIKNGIPRIGLTHDEIIDLSLSGEENRSKKVTTRDLPFLLAGCSSTEAEGGRRINGDFWGATTVASTMHLANLANISTFVTGGTGGVHRDGQNSLDISSDLTQLSTTPVIVISAGIKSILDIPRTLETLETLSVPTATFRSKEYPSFFSPHSGIESPHVVHSAEDVARAFIISKNTLKLKSGMLIAVPNHSPAGQNVEVAIQESLKEVEEKGIVGRDVTPYILQAVAEKTKGDSLKSNMELVKNNARIGAEIAIAVAQEEGKWLKQGQKPSTFVSYKDIQKNTGIKQQQHQGESSFSSSASSTPPSSSSIPQSKVIVMGGIVMDLVAKPQLSYTLIPSTSNPGVCFEADGGVGRNVAEVLGRLGSKPILYSAIGSGEHGNGDSIGRAMIARLKEECGVLTTSDSIYSTASKNDTSRTATYIAILDHKNDLNVAIADMDILQHIPIPTPAVLECADILVLDANPPMPTLLKAAQNAVNTNTKVFFEPTSVPKAALVGTNEDFLRCLTYAFPNLDELMAMADGWLDTEDELKEAHRDGFKTLKLAAGELLNQMMEDNAHLIITLGSDGVMLASKQKTNKKENVKFTHFPAAKGVCIENTTGAGDTLCGAFIHAILNGKSEKEAVKIGMEAAMLSLKCSDRAISPDIGK